MQGQSAAKEIYYGRRNLPSKLLKNTKALAGGAGAHSSFFLLISSLPPLPPHPHPMSLKLDGTSLINTHGDRQQHTGLNECPHGDRFDFDHLQSFVSTPWFII